MTEIDVDFVCLNEFWKMQFYQLFTIYIPNMRKLCTPQNECTPIDWILASLICKTSNLVNGIKIGLIVNGLFELLITNTWIFGSNDCTGIVLIPSANNTLKWKYQMTNDSWTENDGKWKLTAYNFKPSFDIGVTSTFIRAHRHSVC